MIKQFQNILVVGILLSMLFVFLFFVNLHGFVINLGSEQIMTSGASVTELTDVEDIKKRMKFHGCLTCWKDSAGVWWFDRNGKNCKLWSPKEEQK